MSDEAALRAEIARVSAKAARWEARAAAVTRLQRPSFLRPAKGMRTDISVAEKALRSGNTRHIAMVLVVMQSYNNDD